YGIVEQSSGKLEVTTALGQGATFHIYLPRADEQQPAETGAARPETSTLVSATVMVVEDQDSVRPYIRTALEDSGYRVVEASNGPDALALAEQFHEPLHLLLTDIIMPLMNGRELAEKLQLKRPGLKVLFTSGYEEETYGNRGIIAAGLAILPKP